MTVNHVLTRLQLSSGGDDEQRVVRGWILDMGTYVACPGGAGVIHSAASPTAAHTQEQALADEEFRAAMEKSGDDASQGTQLVNLVQVVPVMLAQRVLLFNWPLPLVAHRWQQTGPGFLDAPGAME
jgi:hypothetical protein